MIDKSTDDQERAQQSFRYWRGFGLFIGVLLALGLFFRIVGIDKKIYQHDEVMTSLRIAGFQAGEVREQLVARQEIGIRDLQAYQRVSAEKGVFATLLSLAADDPKHPPLYYVLARLWVYLFGDSAVAIRSLSVVLSLLALVCLYWLCQELFTSACAAWMAVALVAISPFHILYAQEARQYSLWMLTVVLSSAALLRALRRRTWRAWGIYATTVAMGLYAHTLFLLVSFAHGVYVLLTNPQMLTIKKVFSLKESTGEYAAATAAAFLVFAPWAIVIAVQLPVLHETTRWITKEVEFLYIVKRWALGVSSLFFDPSGGVIFAAKASVEKPMTYWIRFPILLLIMTSSFFLCQKTPKRAWCFILTLVGGTMAPLLLADALTGWRTSTPFRYLTPGYIGVQLSVAYLFTFGITSSKVFWRKSWQLAAILLATGMVASCVRNAQAEVWWNKEASYALPQVARLINQGERPLLLSALDGKNLGNCIALSYLLDKTVRFRAIADLGALTDLDGFTEVFLLHPSEHLLQQFTAKGYRLRAEIQSGELWSLVKEPTETSAAIR